MTNRPAPMTLLEAENIVGSDGVRYADRTSEQLLRVANNIKTPPEKVQAARLILAARANPNAIPPMPDDAQAPATTPPPPDEWATFDQPAPAVPPPAAPQQPAPVDRPVKAQQSEPKNSTALQQFGNRAELREFAGRLASMTLPGGKKLSNEEQLALAQVAIAHGLDPFNGEIWIIPGGGIMVGVKGLRKKARQQVRGNFWIDFREIADPDEKARMGIPPEALAYEARLFDTETITTYTDTVGRLLAAKIPWEAVSKMCGEKPYTSGIGFAKPSESSKMTLVARAMKRAEAEALKRRFDIDFGFGVNVSDDDNYQPTQWSVKMQDDYEKDAAALWSE